MLVVPLTYLADNDPRFPVRECARASVYMCVCVHHARCHQSMQPYARQPPGLAVRPNSSIIAAGMPSAMHWLNLAAWAAAPYVCRTLLSSSPSG